MRITKEMKVSAEVKVRHIFLTDRRFLTIPVGLRATKRSMVLRRRIFIQKQILQVFAGHAK